MRRFVSLVLCLAMVLGIASSMMISSAAATVSGMPKSVKVVNNYLDNDGVTVLTETSKGTYSYNSSKKLLRVKGVTSMVDLPFYTSTDKDRQNNRILVKEIAGGAWMVTDAVLSGAVKKVRTDDGTYSFTYESGKPVSMTEPGSSDVLKVTWNRNGQVTKTVQGSLTERYVYTRGTLRYGVFKSSDDRSTCKVTLNDDGRISVMTFSTGGTNKYSYTKAGRLKKITHSSDNSVETFTYNSNGTLKKYVYDYKNGNKITYTFQY